MHITKLNFLNFFKYPHIFWLLNNEEIEEFFIQEDISESFQELILSDQLKLLKFVADSQKSLISENFFKLNSIKDKKLSEAYKKLFSFPSLSFYDYSSSFDDSTDNILSRLIDSSYTCIFFYKPKLIRENLKITPTVIYKYNGKIYIIEHFWSTHLKKESLGIFIFYNHFFCKYTSVKIDQYLVSFLSKEPSPDKELILNIGNSLPFTSLKRVPQGASDPKMKNINIYFGLNMEYRNSLYEKFLSEQEYESINVEEWEIEDDTLENPEYVINSLSESIKTRVEDVDVKKLMIKFLKDKNNWIPPSGPHYRSVFQNFYSKFTYSSKLISLQKSLEIICKLSSEETKNSFFEYMHDMKFILDPHLDQKYLIFENGVSEFEKLRKVKTKVYYDFETVSVPFPVLNNTKPYMQIVLQLSLVTTIEGKEKKPNINLIIDPLEVSIDSFKQIIDAIYLDDVDVVYIVYNKSFENTRLKEMDELIGDPEYHEKVVEIIDKTVDLANWFFYGNNPYIIHQELKGFNSIKKVNKLIPQKILKATKTKNYSDLEKCQNGIIAQSLLLNRLLTTDSKQDEHNWNKNKKFMCDYCENDVRSMIAVEMYIDHLLKSNKLELLNEEKFKKIKLKHKKHPFPPYF